MNPALFLDRDGVIIQNRDNYVRCWADVAIYPQALAALAWVSRFPVKIVIVTNQSAVGRGLVSLSTAQEINARLKDAIKLTGGRIDGIYMCPHHPKDECDCRKPYPGILLRAARELSLDLSRSMLIGDALTDLMAAESAGVPVRILVRTGRGRLQEKLPRAKSLRPFQTHDNLYVALSDQFCHTAQQVDRTSLPFPFS